MSWTWCKNQLAVARVATREVGAINLQQTLLFRRLFTGRPLKGFEKTAGSRES